MKRKNRLYLFLILLIFIPSIIVNAKSGKKTTNVTVTGKKSYTQEKILTWGKNNASYMTTVTLSDGNTAYCIDPGVPAPSGAGTGCTKKIMSGTDAASAINIFNGSTDPVTVGTALRYDNDTKKKTATNSEVIAAYDDPESIGAKMSDKAKAAKKLATNARSAANSAASKNTTAKNPKATLKGSAVTYSDMPDGTTVTIECKNCTNTLKTFTVAGSGTITVDLKADSTKCTDVFADYTITFTGNGSVADGSGGSPSGGGSGSKEKKMTCTKAAEYTCGNNSSSEFQRFIACDETQEVSADDSGDGSDGNKDDGAEIPTVVDIVLFGSLNCNNICQDIVCPDPSNFFDYPPTYPDGVTNELCSSSCSEIKIIDEADELSLQDYTECCVLGNEKNKIEAETDPICGDAKIYCTENYKFNTTKKCLNVDNSSNPRLAKGDTAAGSYFNLVSGPLEDEAEYHCYTKNSTEGIKKAVLVAAEKASTENPNNTRTKITCTPYYETVYECNQLVCDEEGNNCHDEYAFDSTNWMECPNGYRGTHNGNFTQGYKVIQKYNWVPKLSFNGTNFVLNWGWSNAVSYNSGWVYNSSDCYNSDDQYSKERSISVKDFTQDVEKSIATYERECNGVDDGSSEETPGLVEAMINTIGACEREVEFYYFDGDKLGVSHKLDSNVKDFEVIENQTNKKCTKASGTWVCEEAKDTHFEYNIGGLGNSRSFKNSTNSQAAIKRKNEYIIEGTTICNNYSDGTRKFGDDCNDYCDRETDKDPNDDITCTVGWPVAYDTPFGEHEYSFSIKNLDSCLNPDGNKFGMSSFNWDIYCQYAVNGCDNCDFGCDILDECSISFCGSECIQNCLGVGCIYDNGTGLLANYQPISLLNFDSAFLKGKNNYYAVQKLGTFRNSSNLMIQQLAGGGTIEKSQNWSNSKGSATIEKIFADGNGEEIYKGDPQYRVVLTPSSINSIQKYNSEAGGYLNNNDDNKLSCHGLNGGDYIVCESQFLRNYLPNTAHAELQGTNKEFGTDKFTSATSVINASDIKRKSGTGPAWK